MAKGKTQRRLAPRTADGGPRADKVAGVQDFKDRYGQSQAVVLTEYRGLKVSELGELRAKLREAGAEVKVYKNTLATIAVRDLGVEEIAEMLQGPTATVFALQDPVAAAKALSDFSKDHDLLVVKGGILGGRTLGAKDVEALAKLETREVMLAKIAGMFVSPIQSMANVLKASLNNLGSVLAQYRDTLPADGSAAAPAAEAATGEAPAESAPETPAEEPAAEASADPAAEAEPQADGGDAAETVTE